ncbi:unnamed protein product [Brassicogethes aeneus]|uniref:protein disulfide-isomerase n=1 Tax=Brassicogethes aeneus TaxID=1431903 RepID=A0A9P0B701_BRAAE|nr:unnamed protein product [Brassicogethes aeneus]
MHFNSLQKAIIIFIIVTTSPASSLYNSSDDVIELDFNTFMENKMKSEFWLVEFYAPWCGHCQKFAPEYKKTATALKGIAKVAAINCEEDKRLAHKFDIKSYPTIILFGNDVYKEYKGGRSLDELVKFVEGNLNATSDKIQLTDNNFKDYVFNSNKSWMVVFYAPWCGHCKNLKPHWKKAANTFKNVVNFAGLDATIHKKMGKKYIDKGYPTIRYFRSGSDYMGDIYEGTRIADDIIQWVQEKESEDYTPQLKEIINEAALRDSCENTLLCILSFLPNILDCQSECRNTYLNILSETASIYKKQKWGWVWSEGGAQIELENAVEVGGFGYPALVVANYKKSKISVFRGSFSIEGISEFLNDIRSGKGSSLVIKKDKLPKINNVVSWNGQDSTLLLEDDAKEEL